MRWKLYGEKKNDLEKVIKNIMPELDQDIWQIILKLVVFYEMTIGQARALSSSALDGGGGA